ncbi:MAG: hypothetical protein ACK4YP_08315 [Myxococcota bacterium]
MARPTDWKPTKGGGETRTSGKGNTVHRQNTPEGPVEHVNRKDGSSVRVTTPTIPPKNPK